MESQERERVVPKEAAGVGEPKEAVSCQPSVINRQEKLNRRDAEDAEGNRVTR
jgi:hypothetical protein